MGACPDGVVTGIGSVVIKPKCCCLCNFHDVPPSVVGVDKTVGKTNGAPYIQNGLGMNAMSPASANVGYS